MMVFVAILTTNHLRRGFQRTATPIPEIHSPLKDLIPIESSAGPSQDKGKGRAIKAMDEGKSERGHCQERLPCLRIFLCFSLHFAL